MRVSASNRRDRLRAMLADLKMPGALEAVDGVLAQADSGATTAGEAIEQLLNAQIALRNNRRLETAMRASRLPAVKTLAQFDFTFQPSLKREQIESLHELGFLNRAENVILLGPPGVGKTHLAISLAIAAESGRRVYYGTLAGLIESLMEAKAAGNLSRHLPPGRRRGLADTETPIGLPRQGTQRPPLVALEAVHRALSRRAVPAHVRRALQPAPRLLVQILVVRERASVEKAVAKVANRPLHLALGPSRQLHPRRVRR